MKDVFRNVGFYARSETRFFLIALAKRLKAQHDATLHLYCTNPQEAAFYNREASGLFASLTIANPTMEGLKQAPPDESALLAEAQALEARYGVTLNQLAVSNRHLGRGFALGGYRHPRSRISENARYANLLASFVGALRFWEREIAEKGLTMVLNGSREAALVARHQGLPFRTFSGSRYRNLQHWAWNEFHENPEFRIAYDAGEGEGNPTLDVPYHSHLTNRARVMKGASSYRLARRAALEIARHGWWHFKGYEKARGYYLSENLRYFAAIHSEWRLLNRVATVKLEELKGRPFVYYPLHMEPEVALQGLSPDYFNQLGLIAALARDLPAGVMLAVKETVAAIGRRPRDFYGQIAEFKNVIMLETTELGLACAAKAAATATICGTAGFEGAVLGRPVLALGAHNNYNFLPHVWPLHSDRNLTPALRQALDETFDSKAALASGQRFLKAVIARSFDMRDYDFIDVARFEEAAVIDAEGALVRSLDMDRNFDRVAMTPISAHSEMASNRVAGIG